MIITAVILTLIVISFLFILRPKFGQNPKGERLARLHQSPNYRNGNFHNINPTPQMAEDVKFINVFRDNFSAKHRRPLNQIPSVQTNIHTIQKDQNVLIWFGHSSYFMQVDGKRFLIDPVFSGHASPFPFFIKSFSGSNFYQAADIPDIDYLIITHDHWDHLDYKTVMQLKNKIGKVITALGVGQHIEFWGFNKEDIIEKDWYEIENQNNGFQFYCFPARHFSGRIKTKKTLWASFLLTTPTKKIFIGGDGGFDTHFKQVGEQFGEIDLAILENGQYNTAWRYIHMMPDQVLQAGTDLNAKRIFPVHNSKFSLAPHSWNEPLKKISEYNAVKRLNLITPKIGEIVYLDNEKQTFQSWWEEMK